MSRVTTALVIAAVDDSVDTLPDADLVVAADRGAEVARALGRPIDFLVGDMDSVSSETLAAAHQAGVTVVEHPRDKDETDLELALAVAVAAADRVHVVMSATGRLDHALVNMAVISSPRWADAVVEATVDGHRVRVVHDTVTFPASAGEIVSLIPMGGPATGVVTRGLTYELDDETLHPLAGRGVSNVVIASTVTVSIGGGVLMVVTPLER